MNERDKVYLLDIKGFPFVLNPFGTRVALGRQGILPPAKLGYLSEQNFYQGLAGQGSLLSEVAAIGACNEKEKLNGYEMQLGDYELGSLWDIIKKIGRGIGKALKIIDTGVDKVDKIANRVKEGAKLYKEGKEFVKETADAAKEHFKDFLVAQM